MKSIIIPTSPPHARMPPPRPPMIVCICHNINAAQIAELAERHPCTLEEVIDCTGAGTCCGKCQWRIQAALQEPPPAEFYEATACA
ncbi:MAG: (2Fe-2S)-binding protein [Cellvibrionales bacterium]|nr:(2Fe-2S)-binding protein [Cellvibrionales bacterium]